MERECDLSGECIKSHFTLKLGEELVFGMYGMLHTHFDFHERNLVIDRKNLVVVCKIINC